MGGCAPDCVCVCVCVHVSPYLLNQYLWIPFSRSKVRGLYKALYHSVERCYSEVQQNASLMYKVKPDYNSHHYINIRGPSIKLVLSISSPSTSEQLRIQKLKSRDILKSQDSYWLRDGVRRVWGGGSKGVSPSRWLWRNVELWGTHLKRKPLEGVTVKYN